MRTDAREVLIMSNNPFVERRKYPRIETEQVISIALLDAEEILAYGKNLSLGGICFEVAGCELNATDVLRITFNVEGENLVAIGRVTWATDLDPFTQEVGMEFAEIDPAALESIRSL